MQTTTHATSSVSSPAGKIARKKRHRPGKNHHYATGRRKTAIARVFLKSGTGEIIVNQRLLDKYFSRNDTVNNIKQVLVTAGVQHVDIIATVTGGGITGQGGALIHALARALCVYDETTRPALKKAGYLTRDSRAVERKKYGYKKARKQEQYSKR